MHKYIFANVGIINFSDYDLKGIKNEFHKVGQAYATPTGVVNNKSILEHWSKGVLNTENLFVADGFAWVNDNYAAVNARPITEEVRLLNFLKGNSGVQP